MNVKTWIGRSWRVLPLAMIALLVTDDAWAQKKKAATPAPANAAESAPIKIGDWLGEGDGRALPNGAGFAQEGKRSLVITDAKLKEKSFILSAEVLLPKAAASFRIDFAKPQPPTAAPAPAASPTATIKPPTPFVATLDKNGKTVKCGRGTSDIADASATKLPLMLMLNHRGVEIYFNKFEERRLREGDQQLELFFTLASGAQLQNLHVIELPKTNHLPLIEAMQLANTQITGKGATLGKLDAASLPRGLRLINGVPFFFSNQTLDGLDVAASLSGVKEPVRNKSIFFSDASTRANGRLVFKVPGDQYAAVHLIAFSAGRADHAPHTTVRVGRYGGMSAILEDVKVTVPTLTAVSADNAASNVPVKLANGKPGFVHHLRVPLPQTANVKEFAQFDLEFTRDINTHVLPPDPNEFGQIAAGVPSDVVLLAATLEPAPVTMDYVSEELGNVFFDTQKVVFKMTLTNRSTKIANLRAFAKATGPGTGEEFGIVPKTINAEQKLKLKAGESQTVSLDVTPGKRGWFSCALGVELSGEVIQQRDTSFAVLAPDTRRATTDSPFGVWEFWQPHSVAKKENQTEILATLMNKGGWRWTYGGSPVPRGEIGDDVLARMRDKYKIVWNAKSLTDGYQRMPGIYDEEKFKEQIPAEVKHALEFYDPHFKVMHESRSSLDLLRRYSEFLGGVPYDMPAPEREKLEQQFENVKKYCLAIKKIDPRAKVVLFNDYPAVVFQFLQRGFPAEAFDVIGLEGAMFLRQPERQPDWLTLLGHAHEMKRALAKYGYNKPIWTTEALYHPTAPGALSLHEQSVISVREAMMALQLGISRMAAAGIIKDPSDDYHWSNWGSAGFCFRDPEINPKPSYAMYAWLTQIIDQAKPVGKLATPNNSLHAVDFQRPDGSHVYSLWTAKGVQTVTLAADGPVQAFDAFGNSLTLTDLKLTASPTPIYVTGGPLKAVSAAEPLELKGEVGKVLLDFGKADLLREVKSPSKILESNWDTPRMKGEFATSFVEVDGVKTMRLELKPDADARKLLPRYVEYELAKPITLAGRPYEFTARVKGNSGWGRLLFEVVDAKGRVWTSSGNQYAGASNAADPKCDSFVSFEGWHTMRMPIVGMYPAKDQTLYWPRNYNWWPTNSPEEKELAAQAQEFAATYQAELKAFEEATTKHAAALQAWQDAKAAAEKDGKKFAAAAPKPPVAPKPRGVRNMGLAPVDYPLKLTKIMFTMRPNILYLDEERPVTNPVIYIDEIGVVGPPAGM